MQRPIRPRNPYLAAAMARAGLNITRLSSLTGITRQALSRILNQRQGTKRRQAKKIARALGVEDYNTLDLKPTIPGPKNGRWPRNPDLAAAMARAGVNLKSLGALTGILPGTLRLILNRQQSAKPLQAEKIAEALEVEDPASLHLVENIPAPEVGK